MKFIAGLIDLFSLVMAGAAAAAMNRKQQVVPVDAEDADEVALVAIFAPVAFHSTAAAFRGGTLDCWYGGGIVDLRDATLDPAGAHLDVKAVFGGAQIVVPRDWRVEVDVNGIGGARDVRPSRDLPVTAPLLTVSGFVVFGGLGVSSDIPQEALESVKAEMLKRQGRSGSVDATMNATVDGAPSGAPELTVDTAVDAPTSADAPASA